MSIDRTAAVDFAKKFWNKLADDEKFAHHSAGIISVAHARHQMHAPKADWEGVFVSDGNGGEKGVFRSLVDGSEKPDPFVRFDDLDDCTHYVSRCLKAEGVSLAETGRANELAEAMIKSNQTK